MALNCANLPSGFSIYFVLPAIRLAFAALSAQEPTPLVGDHVLVLTPSFARISPRDNERRFDLNFFFPKNLPRPDGIITSKCAISTATYLITTPTGERHSLALTEMKKRRSETERFFLPSSRWEQCLDAIGECTATTQGQHNLIWKKPPPPFNEAGEYRLVISGTFHDKSGVTPDFTFRSNEAVWFVDPSIVPLEILKGKADEALEKDLGCRPSPIVWRVSDTPSGDRRVRGRLRSSDVPEEVARDARKNMPAGLVGFGGLDYGFVYSPRGELLSRERNPHWVFDY